jgi:hypothetical protein
VPAGGNLAAALVLRAEDEVADARGARRVFGSGRAVRIALPATGQ